MKKNISDDWKLELITPNLKINITKKILQYVNDKNILNVDKDFKYENLIKKKNLLNKNYYLRIKKNKDKLWKTITINSKSPFSLNLGEINLQNPYIEIVYFLNADISNCYLKLLKDQLKDLIKSKILFNKNTKLHCILICSSEEKKIKIKKVFENLKIKKYCKTFLKFSSDTYKEYEGIKKVWEIGQTQKTNTYIFYIHGKGLSYLNNKFFYFRQPVEKFLFKILIYNWEKNIYLIERFQSISKLGSLSGKYGWIWFNFWLVKSSYISQLKKPIKTKIAFYYEEWLARNHFKNKNLNLKYYKNSYCDNYFNTLYQSLNILDNPKKLKFNIGSYCEVKKGGFILGFLKVKYKIWYIFQFILNRLNLNKGDKSRFIFY